LAINTISESLEKNFHRESTLLSGLTMKGMELLFHNCDLYLHACSNNKPDPDGSTSESEKDSSSHVSVSAKMSS